MQCSKSKETKGLLEPFCAHVKQIDLLPYGELMSQLSRKNKTLTPLTGWAPVVNGQTEQALWGTPRYYLRIKCKAYPEELPNANLCPSSFWAIQDLVCESMEKSALQLSHATLVPLRRPCRDGRVTSTKDQSLVSAMWTLLDASSMTVKDKGRRSPIPLLDAHVSHFYRMLPTAARVVHRVTCRG